MLDPAVRDTRYRQALLTLARRYGLAIRNDPIRDYRKRLTGWTTTLYHPGTDAHIPSPIQLTRLMVATRPDQEPPTVDAVLATIGSVLAFDMRVTPERGVTADVARLHRARRRQVAVVREFLGRRCFRTLIQLTDAFEGNPPLAAGARPAPKAPSPLPAPEDECPF